MGRLCHAGPLPLLVEADGGFGNARNVARCVQELEAAGAGSGGGPHGAAAVACSHSQHRKRGPVSRQQRALETAAEGGTRRHDIPDGSGCHCQTVGGSEQRAEEGAGLPSDLAMTMTKD